MAKIERVSYHELLITGSYLNVRIGVDLLLNDGEDPKQALSSAKELVREFHKEAFPHVYAQGIDNIPQGEETTPVRLVEKKQSQEEKIIQDIQTCADEKVLASYKLIAKNNSSIQEAYNNKLKQLNNV